MLDALHLMIFVKCDFFSTFGLLDLNTNQHSLLMEFHVTKMDHLADPRKDNPLLDYTASESKDTVLLHFISSALNESAPIPTLRVFQTNCKGLEVLPRISLRSSQSFVLVGVQNSGK